MPHIDPEQLALLAMDEPVESPDDRAHLAACPACTADLVAMRHAAVVPSLTPADVLVDGMRGSSSLWYRVRVNLQHVEEKERPGQEELIADYDPWAGKEWPERAGS